jgi:hypothetical protein
LKEEGDSFNLKKIKPRAATRKLTEEDAVLMEILKLSLWSGIKVFEIGFGDGAHLAWIKKNLMPSAMA